MIAANDAALLFLCRAGLDGQTEAIDANVNRAVNLMRVFNEQAELMQKLKGKMAAQQKVTVEHVHVNAGGKAIVGVQPQLAGVVHEDDAPSCPDCGGIMVRNGACFRCMNCGSTSGCS